LAHPTAHRLIPDCRISVGGKTLELSQDAALTRVDVDLDVDLFGQCILSFNDPKLKLINGKLFASGVAIKVEIGFHTKLKKIFEGEVVGLEPQFRRDLPVSLKVICQESIHRLALSQMTRAFNDVDDKEIVTKIAQEHGLSAKAPSGTKEHILQGNITDAAFLRRLAQKHGNHLRIEGKKLIIGPPPKGADVQVAPGDGLRKVKIKIKASQQVSEISVHGWDPKTKKEIVGKAKGEGEIGKGAKAHGGKATLSFAGHEHAPSDVATAEKMAKGRMRKIAEGFVLAQGEMVGNTGVIPGSHLNLDKMGAKIDGQYRVEHAVHAFSKHGYFVNFKAVRVGKKKPPKPPRHTWSTKEFKGKNPEELEVGPDGKYVAKDKPNEQVHWHKPRLEHLVLAYDEGPNVDAGADAEWDKKNDKEPLENLKFDYRLSSADRSTEDAVDFQKVTNARLDKLKFGYRGESAEEQAAEQQERKKAAHKPRLEKLTERYDGPDSGPKKTPVTPAPDDSDES
jgi:phage protein D